MHASIRLLCAGLVAASLFAGCGEEEREMAPAASATPQSTGGSFSDRPQVVERFTDAASGWPRGGYRRGAFVLDGPAKAVAAFAPERVEPRLRGTLTEVTLEPPADGAAGLTCRASADAQTGYALLLGGDSTVQLARLEDGRATLLKEHRLSPNERSDPGKPSLLRLGCGTGKPGGPTTLSYTVNATPYAFVVDRNSVDPGASANVGVVARDGIARFDDFALWLAS